MALTLFLSPVEILSVGLFSNCDCRRSVEEVLWTQAMYWVKGWEGLARRLLRIAVPRLPVLLDEVIIIQDRQGLPQPRMHRVLDMLSSCTRRQIKM